MKLTWSGGKPVTAKAFTETIDEIEGDIERIDKLERDGTITREAAEADRKRVLDQLRKLAR